MDTLFAANTPACFWRLAPDICSISWQKAVKAAAQVLPQGSEVFSQGGWAALSEHILGEGQFGTDHWRLSNIKQLYYALRPFLPREVRPVLRRLSAARIKSSMPLSWPVEDRYARFLFDTLSQLIKNENLDSVTYLHFWPYGKQFALVLTHDVESSLGCKFVRTIAALEERYGFRSCFNFVPEVYKIDLELLAELRERGFEIGVHGLKHDGRMFSSQESFFHQASQINKYVQLWNASGFRSPLTHRQPQWMQALDIEYDTSFFDTDPFEPIPGGSMSIWPFFLGHFVELPYTLVQDHTLIETLGETTPRIWLEKVNFIRRYFGMAMLNSHPDYMHTPIALAIYEEFLRQMSSCSDYWHNLPCKVAHWWRHRAKVSIEEVNDRWVVIGLPEASICEIDASLLETPQDGKSILQPTGTRQKQVLNNGL